MKKLLLGMTVIAGLLIAGAAQAADMPLKAPRAAPPVYFSWTGFYIGAHVGGLWSEKDWTEVCSGFGTCVVPDVGGPFSAGPRPSSFLGGAQAGFNWQTGAWVWGVETQWSWTDADECSAVSGNLGGFFAVNRADACSTINWVGTVAARLGFAADRWLFYVKGGVAFADEEHVFLVSSRNGPGAGLVGSALTTSASDTRTGWMVGGGIEYAFGGNWSAKVEYNFMDFGSQTYRFTTLPFTPNSIHDVDIDQQIHVVKFGINYRFGGPVVGRY
jgi:outer membrane immunogenic protein